MSLTGIAADLFAHNRDTHLLRHQPAPRSSCTPPDSRALLPPGGRIESAMAEGSRQLDDHERALTTLVTITDKAGATQLEWLAALTQTHSDVIRDVSTAYRYRPHAPGLRRGPHPRRHPSRAVRRSGTRTA